MIRANWHKLLLAAAAILTLFVVISVVLVSDRALEEPLPTLAPTWDAAQAGEAAVALNTTALPTPVPPEPTAVPTDTPTVAPTEPPTATATPTAEDTAAVPTQAPSATLLPPTQAPVQQPRVTVLQVSGGMPPAEPVPNVVVLRVEPAQLARLQADVRALGGTVEVVNPALGAVTVQLPDESAAEALSQVEYVQAAEPDYYVSAQLTATDPRISDQWSLSAMNIPLSLPDDLTPIKVAVIDSGICADHPELSGKILGGHDFIEGDDTPQDEMGHGCAVAGIIAANWDGQGMAGVAPNARLLIYRVLNAQGSGRYSNVASAIVRAVDDGAQIINLSLGGVNPSQLLQDAVDYAISRGVLVIAAAGNSGSSSVLYPAAYPNVVSVGALAMDGTRALFSNTGKVELWAPGVNVLSLTLANGHTTMSGTSFAAPNVAGLAALEMAQGRSLALGGNAYHQVTPSPTLLDSALSTTEPTQDVPLQELFDLIRETIIDRIGDQYESRIRISEDHIERFGNWVLGTAVILGASLNDDVPSDNGTLDFISFYDYQSEKWNLYFYDSPEYQSVKMMAPAELLPVQPQSVNYDRVAAINRVSGNPHGTTWWSPGGPIGNYNDGVYRGVDNHGNWRQGRHCTTKISQALAAGGVIPSSTRWSGNGQVVQWMIENPHAWEFRSGIHELLPGDFILISQFSHAPDQWSYRFSNGASLWNHIMLVTGNNTVGEWNPERYSVSESSIWPSLPYRRFVHIKTTTTQTSWNFANGLQGWTVLSHLSGQQQLPMGIRFNVTDWDPYMVSPLIAGLSANQYSHAYIEMSASKAGGGSSSAQIYIQNSGMSGFAEPHVPFTVPLDGSTRSYLVDLRGNPYWTGGISRLRLDPGDRNAIGATIRIDRFELVNLPPNLAPPTTAPVVSAPAVTNNNRPTVLWNSVPNADRYTVEFLMNNVIVHANTVTGTSYTPPGALPDGTYSVRVRALNALGQAGPNSAPRSVTIDTVPPANPQKVSPAPGAEVRTFTPTFCWQRVPDAAVYEVSWQPYQSARTTSTCYTMPRQLVEGQQWWNVIACDQAGNCGSWVDAFPYTIVSPTNSAPRVVRQGTNPRLTWNPQDWALGYEVQIATNSSFTALYGSYTLPADILSMTVNDMPVGTYYWRIRIKSGATTWSPWSQPEMLIVR